MPTYVYEAFDHQGAPVKGEYDAGNEGVVAVYLESKGLMPVVIQEKGKVRDIHGLSLSFMERITAVDRIFLLRNLAAMIKAGLSIMEGIDILIVDAEKKLLKRILTTAKFNLEKGQPLSATFAYYRKHFSPIFVGLVKAGEVSGRIVESFEELIQHLSREYGLIKKVRSALAYPVILVVASIAVVSSLLFFVLPRLAVSFQRSGAELPLVTKIVIGASNIVVNNPFVFAVILGALIWFLVYWRRTAVGSRVFFRIIFKIPIVRDLIKKVALVRFTRTLGSLIESGLGIIEAIDLSARAVGNNIYKKAIIGTLADIKNGMPLSKALKQEQKLFPHLLVSMMAVGEKTGTLADVLKNFSNFYEEEVDNTLKDFVTFLEPALLLIMGLVIGVIAISILLPIYQLVGKFI